MSQEATLHLEELDDRITAYIPEIPQHKTGQLLFITSEFAVIKWPSGTYWAGIRHPRGYRPSETMVYRITGQMTHDGNRHTVPIQHNWVLTWDSGRNTPKPQLPRDIF